MGLEAVRIGSEKHKKKVAKDEHNVYKESIANGYRMSYVSAFKYMKQRSVSYSFYFLFNGLYETST